MARDGEEGRGATEGEKVDREKSWKRKGKKKKKKKRKRKTKQTKKKVITGAGSAAWRSPERSARRLGTRAPIPHTLRGRGGAEGDGQPFIVVVDVIVMAKKLL